MLLIIANALEQFDILMLSGQTMHLWLPTNINVVQLFLVLGLYFILFFSIVDVFFLFFSGTVPFYAQAIRDLIEARYLTAFDSFAGLSIEFFAEDDSGILIMNAYSKWLLVLFELKQQFSVFFYAVLSCYDLIVNIVHENVLQRKNMNVIFIFFCF